MRENRSITTTNDEEKCVGCGKCLEVCPHDNFTLQNKKSRITGDESLVCDHCGAVCPEGAIKVGGLDHSLSRFTHFKTSERWLPHGEYDVGGLVNLMRSRRSCRNFQDKPVEKSLLEDLVKVGVTAPSGSNCQLWTFTILPERSAVLDLGLQLKRFFEGLNRTADRKWLRLLLKAVGKPELQWYYENYHSRIKEGLEDWDKEGKDMLFHGAPAVIVVGSKKEASCAAEDALLATQNILLAAHALGLGSCLIGFAISAMNRDKSIRDYIGIPDDEDPYAVIALGYPEEKYRTVTGRKAAEVRYYDK